MLVCDLYKLQRAAQMLGYALHPVLSNLSSIFCSRSSSVVLAIQSVNVPGNIAFLIALRDIIIATWCEFQMVVKADLQRPGVCKATDMDLTPRLRASRSRRDTSDALHAPGHKSPVTRPRVGS